MNTELDLTADVIDVRDVIARVEELRAEKEDAEHDDDGNRRTGYEWASDATDDAEELTALESILSDLCGNGGDEQWEGDWYPVTLIADHYFETYMDDMLEDCGDLPKNLPFYLRVVVDYDALKMDYTTTEIDGNEYYYR